MPTDKTQTPIPVESPSIGASASMPPLRGVERTGNPSDAAPSEAPLPSGILRQLDKGFIYLDRLIARWVPDSLNPMLHTGAIAVTTLFIATLTGVVIQIGRAHV